MSSPVICIGAALVDEIYFCQRKTIAGTSNPAQMKKHTGGVAGNIASHLALLGIPTQLITVLGNDPDGNWLFEACNHINVGTDAVLRVNDHTGKYVSIMNPDGSLFVAACTDPCEKYLTPDFFIQQVDLLSTAAFIIADTNLSATSLQWLVSFSRHSQIPLIIEPVSVPKAK